MEPAEPVRVNRRTGLASQSLFRPVWTEQSTVNHFRRQVPYNNKNIDNIRSSSRNINSNNNNDKNYNSSRNDNTNIKNYSIRTISYDNYGITKTINYMQQRY